MRNYEDERTLAMGNSSRPSEELLRHENLFLPQPKGKTLESGLRRGKKCPRLMEPGLQIVAPDD